MNLQRQCQSNKKENIPGNGFTLFSGKDMVRNSNNKLNAIDVYHRAYSTNGYSATRPNYNYGNETYNVTPKTLNKNKNCYY